MTSEAAVKKNTPKTAALSFSAFSMERRARPAESRAQFFSEISYLLLSQFGSLQSVTAARRRYFAPEHLNPLETWG
jgi:hypothetical protein